MFKIKVQKRKRESPNNSECNIIIDYPIYYINYLKENKLYYILDKVCYFCYYKTNKNKKIKG